MFSQEMQAPSLIAKIAAVGMLLLIVACQGSESEGAPETATPTNLVVRNENGAAQARVRVDATVSSSDGTSIAFTVYAPSIAGGNSAPLLITGPGWGGARIRDLDSTSVDALDILQRGARIALEEGPQGGPASTAGWYVIAIDHRGFGGSGGQASLQDPSLEGRDLSAVITWAEQNLPRLAFRRAQNGDLDPVVGAIGGSYGGGFQTIGAGVDTRIDAIVPAVTWHDITTSLFDPPNAMWATLLYNDQAVPAVKQAMVQAATVGIVDTAYLRELFQHSPAAYCTGQSDRMTMPRVPAFFIQAAGDTLFNLTQGLANFECFRQANANSKFLGLRGWHWYDSVVPAAPRAVPEVTISCGSASISVPRMAFSFLAQNLVDSRLDAARSSAYLSVPDVRSVLDDGKPILPGGASSESKCFEATSITSAAGAIPRAGAVFTAAPTAVLAGLPAALAPLIGGSPMALLMSPVTAPFFLPDSGHIVDLVPARSSSRAIFGVPTAQLVITPAAPSTATSNPPVVFLGLVRVRADGSKELLHDQVVPVEGFGAHSVVLSGVSAVLLPNERLGAVVFGFHPRYFSRCSRSPVNTVVSDLSVNLPIEL